jgi:tetratricopeptide (TPR) repeat protein
LKAINSKSATEKIELLTKAIELNDSNFNLFYSRAVEYFGQKIYDKAKSDFLRSVKRLIYFPAYEFLGKIYIDEGSFEEARKAFNNILRYNSRYFGAYLGLGNLAYIESKFEESIEHFTKAIEIAPESPDGFNGRACCKRLLGQFDEALQDIYRALELDPNHVFSLSTLAEIKADQGKLSEFYLTLEMALKLDAKSLESIIAKEKIYKRFYDEERFLKMLEKYNIPLVNNL